MKLVNTPQGEVRLLPPPVELLRAIRAFMPFGAVRYVPPQQGADFGLIMQCGEQELFAVKQQPMDCDKEQSRISFEANIILITHSLAGYLAHGFGDLFMPCTYSSNYALYSDMSRRVMRVLADHAYREISSIWFGVTPPSQPQVICRPISAFIPG